MLLTKPYNVTFNSYTQKVFCGCQHILINRLLHVGFIMSPVNKLVPKSFNIKHSDFKVHSKHICISIRINFYYPYKYICTDLISVYYESFMTT